MAVWGSALSYFFTFWSSMSFKNALAESRVENKYTNQIESQPERPISSQVICNKKNLISSNSTPVPLKPPSQPSLFNYLDVV